uniref:F-box domain-containing protein n=1 Tax=Electrophorus electricus TaxID=8005 RepID=A0A4W4H0A1_ELEEL
MSDRSRALSQSVVLRSLRSARDRLCADRRSATGPRPDESATRALLDTLPVDLQFLIMTYLSPQDLCRLGGTNRYWRSMVQDPLLWRYFLLRDMSGWSSVDHLSLPQTGQSGSAVPEGGDTQWSTPNLAEYLRCSPECRRQWRQRRPAYEAVASFLQALVAGVEPRYAMFGPGLEQLDVSLMRSMMHTPAVLPVAGIPQRQIDGVGSGISFMYKGQQRFNIITLYSTNSTERQRARLEQLRVHSKLFVQQGAHESGRPRYTVTPQVQVVCQAVNGFIFVANAETWRGKNTKSRTLCWHDCEIAQVQAMLQPTWGPASRPVLVLSCTSRDGRDRTPCVTVAHQLQLSLLHNPWMVQDTVAESLAGLLDGIDWLLKHSGIRI